MRTSPTLTVTTFSFLNSCAENCGQCGGVGCGTIPGTGGSEACCSSTISVNGTDCLDTQAAPCIIGDWVPTPSPTVFESAAPVGEPPSLLYFFVPYRVIRVSVLSSAPGAFVFRYPTRSPVRVLFFRGV